MNKNLFSKEKIFIAGANGMVGSAIKRALINMNIIIYQIKAKL